MKNKKLLNILILLLSLLTLIADILLFAFPAFKCASNLLLILYWTLNSLTLLSLTLAILLTLVSLFMDDYISSRVTETFVLFAFLTTFANVIIFALSKSSLTFGYIIVTLLAFVTANISQIVRLLGYFPNWKESVAATFRTHGVVIDATNKKENNKKVKDNVKVKVEDVNATDDVETKEENTEEETSDEDNQD